MSDQSEIPKLDPGLLLVENRIRQLSAELGRPVDCLQWPRPKELLEVEGDPEIQRQLWERIKEV